MKTENKLMAYGIAFSFIPLVVLVTAFDVAFWEAVAICLFVSFLLWSYQTVYQFGLVWLDKPDTNCHALVADFIKEEYPAPTHYEETVADWLSSLSQDPDIPAAHRVLAGSAWATENSFVNQLTWPVRLWRKSLSKARLDAIKREFKNAGYTIY